MTRETKLLVASGVIIVGGALALTLAKSCGSSPSSSNKSGGRSDSRPESSSSTALGNTGASSDGGTRAQRRFDPRIGRPSSEHEKDGMIVREFDRDAGAIPRRTGTRILPETSVALRQALAPLVKQCGALADRSSAGDNARVQLAIESNVYSGKLEVAKVTVKLQDIATPNGLAGCLEQAVRSLRLDVPNESDRTGQLSIKAFAARDLW